MHSGVRLKKLIRVLLPALAIVCALPVAAAGAHYRHHFGGFLHHGFWADDAAVAGTVTSVGSGNFAANAYAITPGAGNSSSTPSGTAVTITLGTQTKVVTAGQSGIAAGDDFYAVYEGVPADTPLSTLASDTPTVVYAYAAPTPEVEVKGVITTAPGGGSDSFTATAYVVAPEHFFPVRMGTGPVARGSAQVSSARLRGARLRSHCLPVTTPVSDGTPGTVITTDSSTQITIDGQSSPVSNLAVGDYFTAVYDGTPDESLSTITSTPAQSVSAWAPFTGDSLYAFVGTVTGTDTTNGTVSVNVTRSFPNGLFSGADTFDVGSQTIVLGNSGSTLFGSLGNVQTGDVVAGGLIAPSGESAATVESTPLQVLVDFPQPSSSNSSATAQRASVRRAEHRALRLLRREKAKYGHHRKR